MTVRWDMGAIVVSFFEFQIFAKLMSVQMAKPWSPIRYESNSCALVGSVAAASLAFEFSRRHVFDAQKAAVGDCITSLQRRSTSHADKDVTYGCRKAGVIMQLLRSRPFSAVENDLDATHSAAAACMVSICYVAGRKFV